MNQKQPLKPIAFPPAMPPPSTLRPHERAQMAKDIADAQRALERVYKTATSHKDMGLAKTMTEINKRLGEQIVAIHGGPMKMSAAELIV